MAFIYANSGVREHAFNLRISAQLRTLWHFKKTFPGVHERARDLILGLSFEVHKKMFENEAHYLAYDKVNTVSINNLKMSC